MFFVFIENKTIPVLCNVNRTCVAGGCSPLLNKKCDKYPNAVCKEECCTAIWTDSDGKTYSDKECGKYCVYTIL